jgi:hypothetical protein
VSTMEPAQVLGLITIEGRPPDHCMQWQWTLLGLLYSLTSESSILIVKHPFQLLGTHSEGVLCQLRLEPILLLSCPLQCLAQLRHH